LTLPSAWSGAYAAPSPSRSHAPCHGWSIRSTQSPSTTLRSGRSRQGMC
jgi:hypothetical protein